MKKGLLAQIAEGITAINGRLDKVEGLAISVKEGLAVVSQRLDKLEAKTAIAPAPATATAPKADVIISGGVKNPIVVIAAAYPDKGIGKGMQFESLTRRLIGDHKAVGNAIAIATKEGYCRIVGGRLTPTQKAKAAISKAAAWKAINA